MEPRDENGDVVYGQNESILNYNQVYAQKDEWTAYIDMDEFIYSKYNLKQQIQLFVAKNVGNIVLLQKKFDDRFNNLDKPVACITKCIDGIDTSQWGPKNLIQNNKFDCENLEDWNIHFLPTKDCNYAIANRATLRFNHYNVNAVQLRWMKHFYKSEQKFKLNSDCFELFKQFKKRQSKRL